MLTETTTTTKNKMRIEYVIPHTMRLQSAFFGLVHFPREFFGQRCDQREGGFVVDKTN